MKQLIYGPSGYGKSHMVLHSLPEKKVVYITTNGIRQEFNCVGLNTKLLSVKKYTLISKKE